MKTEPFDLSRFHNVESVQIGYIPFGTFSIAISLYYFCHKMLLPESRGLDDIMGRFDHRRSEPTCDSSASTQRNHYILLLYNKGGNKKEREREGDKKCCLF